jgi:pyridoxamine 5'-phosphate oxidase-like protein
MKEPELLELARELGARESGLAVAVTGRADGSHHATVVNAGFVSHPISGDPIVAFVSRGYARKLVHLRRQPRLTVLFRSGWEWVAIEGTVELAGPDDDLSGLEADAVLRLVRRIYASAVGGTEEEWAGLDHDYLAERHTAVLVSPSRVYGGNP